MVECKIVRFREEYAKQVATLFNYVFASKAAFYKTPGSWEWRYLHCPYFDLEGGYVGKCNKYIVTSVFGIVEPRFLADNTPVSVLTINDVATHPSFRGRGLATGCMKKVMDYGKRKNADFSYLITEPGSIAHGIYSRLGYKDAAYINIFIIPVGTSGNFALETLFVFMGGLHRLLTFRIKDSVGPADIRDYKEGMKRLHAHLKPDVDEKWFKWVNSPPTPRRSYSLAVKRHGKLVAVGRLGIKPLSLRRVTTVFLGTLGDVWAQDSRALVSLIGYSIDMARQERVAAILFPQDRNSMFARMLKRMGVVNVLGGVIMVAEFNKKLPVGTVHVSLQDNIGEP